MASPRKDRGGNLHKISLEVYLKDDFKVFPVEQGESCAVLQGLLHAQFCPSVFKREEFKVMKWSHGLPEHKSMELTLGASREPDLSRQGE